LGVPVSGSRLHVKDWVYLDEKILKRLDGWKSASLSYGGKLILLNACLSSTPTYAMSMYLLPKTLVKKMDRTRKKFFWQGNSVKKKYYLVKWSVIERPKRKGGLGVKDLRRMNISLLCKWWWKIENEEGLWQEIVRKKYKIKGEIVQLKTKQSNSPLWNDLIKINDLYLKGRDMKIGNGRDTDFRRDSWCDSIPLKERFRELFDLCNEQKGSVADVAGRRWRLTFRRWLDEPAQNQLRQLRAILTTCALGDEKYMEVGESKNFSVKTMYAQLCRTNAEIHNKRIWKAKIPLKVKVFIWLLQQNAILTKDNLVKRNWHGDKSCRFCNLDENINHLFFDCSLAKYVWSLVAMVIGADCRPSSLDQFWMWCGRYMPRNGNLHMVGLASICWGMWQTRNAICFEKKKSDLLLRSFV
jgi:hypothetical protein